MELNGVEYLSMKALAKYLNISTSLIWLERKRGKFPLPMRFGRQKLFWKKLEIDEWLNACPRIDIKSEC